MQIRLSYGLLSTLFTYVLQFQVMPPKTIKKLEKKSENVESDSDEDWEEVQTNNSLPAGKNKLSIFYG